MSEVISLLFRLERFQKRKEITSTSFPSSVLQRRCMVTWEDINTEGGGIPLIKEPRVSCLYLHCWSLHLSLLHSPLPWLPGQLWQSGQPFVSNGVTSHWMLLCSASVGWCSSALWLYSFPLWTRCTTHKDENQVRTISLWRCWYWGRMLLWQRSNIFSFLPALKKAESHSKTCTHGHSKTCTLQNMDTFLCNLI